MKPNILFIHCDSMDGRALGCAGHPALRRATPNLDALAAAGTLFANACSNSPLCVPSRASMWSGRYAHRCRAWNNYKGLEGNERTFAHELADAGYLYREIGKTDYLSGRHSLRARVTAWLRSAGIERPHTLESEPAILPDAGGRDHESDWRKVDEARAFLAGRAGNDRSFCLYLGLNQPHPPFAASRRYLDLVDADAVTVPPPDEEEHPAARFQRVTKGWAHGYAPETVRRTRRIYYAMVAEVDAMVGAVLAALRDAGLADSTGVIFSGDHGELNLEHGQTRKLSPYEGSVRVPLIMAGPGLARGAVREELVSLVDIYPTMAGLAGRTAPAGLDGQSLLPLAAGARATRRNRVFSEAHANFCPTGWFMLRRDDWKYVAHPGYGPQLFELRADPDEVRNLAAERPETVAELDRELRAVVDYPAVDREAKAYDRAAFRAWREAELAAGAYRETMARIFFNWSDADEAACLAWLAGKNVPDD